MTCFVIAVCVLCVCVCACVRACVCGMGVFLSLVSSVHFVFYQQQQPCAYIYIIYNMILESTIWVTNMQQQLGLLTFLPNTTSPKPGPWKWKGTPVPAPGKKKLNMLRNKENILKKCLWTAYSYYYCARPRQQKLNTLLTKGKLFFKCLWLAYSYWYCWMPLVFLPVCSHIWTLPVSSPHPLLILSSSSFSPSPWSNHTLFIYLSTPPSAHQALSLLVTGF